MLLLFRFWMIRLFQTKRNSSSRKGPGGGMSGPRKEPIPVRVEHQSENSRKQ